MFKGYRLDFYWPTKRRRDKDNAAAMCKAYLDGVADCTGQDDSEWEFYGVRFEIDKENPRVEFHFTTIKEATEQVDELTELRKDKARLAFLLKDKWVNIEYCSVEIYALDEIDAAMEAANNEN